MVILSEDWFSPTATATATAIATSTTSSTQPALLPYADRRLHIMSYNTDVRAKATKEGKVFLSSVHKLAEPAAATVQVEIIGKGVAWQPHLFFNK
mgnify:FL=1